MESYNPIDHQEVSPPKKKIRSLERWWMQNSHRLRTYHRSYSANGEITWSTSEGEPIRRDIIREQRTINTYLRELERITPDYFNLIYDIAISPSFHSMSPNNRVSVLIPAYNEGTNLYQLLSLYTKQTVKDTGEPMGRDKYEINILVNRPEGTAGDNSIDEIERFKRETENSPDVPIINYFDIQFDPSHGTVGNARKHISDVTLLRSIQRSTQNGVLYLESEDADLDFVDPRTINNIIDKFDKFPYLDALRGIQERTRTDLAKNDWIFLKERLWNFLEIVCRRQTYRPQHNPEWHGFWNRIITGGWNTAFTAEALAMIGGYTPTKGIGEDTEIGEKIARIRGTGSENRLDVNLDVISTVPSRSSSSIRRLLSEKIRATDRYIPVEFMDEEVNKLIRTRSIDELLTHHSIKRVERLNEDNLAEFDEMVGLVFNTALSLYKGEEIFNSVMFHAGFHKDDYIIGDTLKVVNWENVKKKLEQYRLKLINRDD